MKKHIAIAFFLLVVRFSYSQNEVKIKPDLKVDWAGQITLGKDAKTNLFLTLGGPNIKSSFGKITFNAGMFPSLKYNYKFDAKNDKTPLAPILGAGVQVAFYRFVAGCLFYSIKNVWYATPALGYKIK